MPLADEPTDYVYVWAVVAGPMAIAAVVISSVTVRDDRWPVDRHGRLSPMGRTEAVVALGLSAFSAASIVPVVTAGVIYLVT